MFANGASVFCVSCTFAKKAFSVLHNYIFKGSNQICLPVFRTNHVASAECKKQHGDSGKTHGMLLYTEKYK